MTLTKETLFRGGLYAVVLFLTPFADKVVPVLYQDKWPTLQVVVACCLVGLIAALVGLRAYFDGSAERARQANETAAGPPLVPLWLLAALLAGVVAGGAGCQSNRYRVAYNTVDTLNSAVTAAERVWASYQVREAKAALVAEGVATPGKQEIITRALLHPDYARIERLDTDYRVAAAAFIHAAQAAQLAEKAEGSVFLLDPVWRAQAVTAANALIEAIATITQTRLQEAK
jgi:hypothetical protein